MKFTIAGTPPNAESLKQAKEDFIKKALRQAPMGILVSIASVVVGFVVPLLVLLLFMPPFFHPYRHLQVLTQIIPFAFIFFMGGFVLFMCSLIHWLEQMVRLEKFEPIEKSKCSELANSLQYPQVAEYCRQVANQAREITNGEYEAINEYTWDR